MAYEVQTTLEYCDLKHRHSTIIASPAVYYILHTQNKEGNNARTGVTQWE